MNNSFLDVMFETCNDNYMTPFEVLSSGNLQSGEYMTEAAHYKFWPRWKSYAEEYPDLAKYDDLMKEADKILNKEGEMSEGMGATIVRAISKTQHVLQKVVFAVNIALSIPIVSIPCTLMTHLFARLFDYAAMYMDYTMAEKTAVETIGKLKDISKKTKDKKVKANIDDLIEKIQDNLDDMREVKKKKEKQEEKKKGKETKESAYTEADLLDDFDFLFD